MELVREFYRRLMGNDGWQQIGQIVGGLALGLFAAAGFFFGKQAGYMWFGGLCVFVAGGYFGMWLERRRISEMIGVDIKPGH